jgi:adenylyltransferase/sulfurtransferase
MRQPWFGDRSDQNGTDNTTSDVPKTMMVDSTHKLDRYIRQIRYPNLGEQGQQRLLQSRVLLCGCGALGSVLANTVARAGIGHIRLVDRDFLELNNLQRQVLYDEQDVAAGLPKAVAAEAKLRKINSQIEIEAIVADVDPSNIAGLLEDVDLILDGTDNFETRFLLNDAAVKFQLPWVYGGCIGAEGQTMTIIPGQTPCLRCLMQDAPPPGTTPTCDTAGILGPIVNVIASIQACEAIKILSGNPHAISRSLQVFELWDNRIRQVGLESLKDNVQCPTCQGTDFPWLDGRRGSHTAVLCGRNAVQLSFPDRESVSLDRLAGELQGVGTVTQNRFLLRFTVDKYIITVFPDGRAIIGGTDDIAEARTVYAKYIGS